VIIILKGELKKLRVHATITEEGFIVKFYNPASNGLKDTSLEHIWKIKRNGLAYKIFEGNLKAIECLG